MDNRKKLVRQFLVVDFTSPQFADDAEAVQSVRFKVKLPASIKKIIGYKVTTKMPEYYLTDNAKTMSQLRFLGENTSLLQITTIGLISLWANNKKNHLANEGVKISHYPGTYSGSGALNPVYNIYPIGEKGNKIPLKFRNDNFIKLDCDVIPGSYVSGFFTPQQYPVAVIESEPQTIDLSMKLYLEVLKERPKRDGE